MDEKREGGGGQKRGRKRAREREVRGNTCAFMRSI